MGTSYRAALDFFVRATLADRFSTRTASGSRIGLLGPRWGKALYTRLLAVRRVDTVLSA